MFELQNSLGKWITPLNIAMAGLTLILIGILTWSNRRMKAILPGPITNDSPLPEEQIS
jgi:hypothetical protein